MRVIAAPILLALFAGTSPCQDPGAPVNFPDLVQHYTQVEQELRAANVPLTPEQASRRARAIDLLHDYCQLANFGIDDGTATGRQPWFVDPNGRRCAVAFLMDHTGQGQLTQVVARDHNHAWIADLVDVPALQDWLQTNGLSMADAARIQAPGRGGGWGGRPPRQRPAPPPPRNPAGNATPDENRRPTGGATPPSTRNPVRVGPTPAARATGTTNAGQRGIALADLETASWTDWWEWNRGHLTMPANVREAAAANQGTAPPGLRNEAESLLRKLSSDEHPAIRSAAMRALGRIGTGAELIEKSSTDPAREVQLAGLLGLGSAGNAPFTHRLMTQLVREERSDNESVIIAALGAKHSEPIDGLVDTLLQARFDHDNSQEVLATTTIIGSARPQQSLRDRALARLQKDESPFTRAMAAELLGANCSAAETAALTRAVSERSPEVRRSAALALGRSHGELALPALLTAFELENDTTTKAQLLLAIGDHGGANGGAFLRAQLTEGKKPLRAFAAIALGLWGMKNSSNDLVELLSEGYRAERNQDQVGAYLIGLGLLAEPRSLPLLTAALRTGTTSSARAAAATALSLLPDARGLTALVTCLQDDACSLVRSETAGALANLGDHATDALVRAMAEDSIAEVRAEAAWALGGTGSPRAARILMRTAADASTPALVRSNATAALGRMFAGQAPQLPTTRYQHNYTLMPDLAAWALLQEL